MPYESSDANYFLDAGSSPVQVAQAVLKIGPRLPARLLKAGARDVVAYAAASELTPLAKLAMCRKAFMADQPWILDTPLL